MKSLLRIGLIVLAAAAVCAICVVAMRAAYPRPYSEEVKKSGVSPSLVYAVMKAESGFREDAVSRAGAVGLMQLKPATAEFICSRQGIAFEADRLSEGSYNVFLGCAYLNYLFARFSETETALAAYNAGEGNVRRWLSDEAYSADGKTLSAIPFSETRAYVKKVLKFQKFYQFLYGKT